MNMGGNIPSQAIGKFTQGGRMRWDLRRSSLAGSANEFIQKYIQILNSAEGLPCVESERIETKVRWSEGINDSWARQEASESKVFG